MMHKAFSRRKKEERRQRQILAYDTAGCLLSMLGAAFTGKDIPAFEEIFECEGAAVPASDEEVRDAIISLNAAMGGKYIKRTEVDKCPQ